MVALDVKLTGLRKHDFDLDMMDVEHHKWVTQASVLEDTIRDIDAELQEINKE